MFATKAVSRKATDTSHRKQQIFIYEYPLHCALLPIKIAQQKAVLG
jgi:hypothetical protein